MSPLDNRQIRAARFPDIPAMQQIEIAAGQAFRTVGMAAIADDPPPSEAVIGEFITAGHAWVVEQDGQPVAYIVIAPVDDAAHIEQVSVHPGASGQRLGQALIDTVAAWAVRRRLAALTLTTFAHVPWNAPYYRRLGFVEVETLGDGLRRIRDEEAARGLDQWPRVAMRRVLDRE